MACQSQSHLIVLSLPICICICISWPVNLDPTRYVVTAYLLFKTQAKPTRTSDMKQLQSKVRCLVRKSGKTEALNMVTLQMSFSPRDKPLPGFSG